MKISKHFVHTSTRQHRKEDGGGKWGRLQTTFATHYSIFAINLSLFSIHRYFVDYFWLAERIGQEMRNWPQERKLMEMKLKMDKDGCNKMNLPFQREQPSWCLLYLHTPKILTQVLPWYLNIYLLVQLTYPGRKPQNSQASIFNRVFRANRRKRLRLVTLIRRGQLAHPSRFPRTGTNAKNISNELILL